MGLEQNKTVVVGYLTGMHASPPDLTVFDELLAPNYEGDAAKQKAIAAAVHNAIREQSFDVVDVVAEGDAVVVRFTYRLTLLDGTVVTARGFAHDRLAGGKIVAQDVITDPDMGPVFGPLLSGSASH